MVVLPDGEAQKVHQGLAVGEAHHGLDVLRVLPVAHSEGEGAVAVAGLVVKGHVLQQVGPGDGLPADLPGGGAGLTVPRGLAVAPDDALLRPLLHLHEKGVDQVLIVLRLEGVLGGGVPVAVRIGLHHAVGTLQQGHTAPQEQAGAQHGQQDQVFHGPASFPVSRPCPRKPPGPAWGRPCCPRGGRSTWSQSSAPRSRPRRGRGSGS